MASDRLRMLTALVGASLALGAATVRWLNARGPEYSLAVPGNPVDVYPDGAAPTTGHLSRRFDLPVTNSGRRPIRITAVKSSCSCTLVGPVSPDLIAPRRTLIIPLQLDLPPYGSKTTALTLETSAPMLPAIEVRLRLHGPAIEAPMIVSSAYPVQFITQSARELVLHEFTVVTMEKLNGEPWLIGMSSSLADSNVERLRVEDIQQYPEVNIVKRRYDFLLRFIGPATDHDLLAFTIQPESNVPSVRDARPLHVRCQLALQDVAAISHSNTAGR